MRSTFCTQYISCDTCYNKLVRKLRIKEKGIYVGQPYRYYGQHGIRMFSGCYVNGKGYEDMLSILIKAAICHPVQVVIWSEDGVKQMDIEPLKIKEALSELPPDKLQP